jgi:hypothetical protein
VYKKKIEGLSELKAELLDAQEDNQRLYNEIEVLNKEKEKKA